MGLGMGLFLEWEGLKHVISMLFLWRKTNKQTKNKCEEQRGMAKEQQKQNGRSERAWAGMTEQVEGGRREHERFPFPCHRGKGESCRRREAVWTSAGRAGAASAAGLCAPQFNVMQPVMLRAAAQTQWGGLPRKHVPSHLKGHVTDFLRLPQCKT